MIQTLSCSINIHFLPFEWYTWKFIIVFDTNVLVVLLYSISVCEQRTSKKWQCIYITICYEFYWMFFLRISCYSVCVGNKREVGFDSSFSIEIHLHLSVFALVMIFFFLNLKQLNNLTFKSSWFYFFILITLNGLLHKSFKSASFSERFSSVCYLHNATTI